MCAYNKVNGTYASEHHWLLTEVLRDEWGFEGLVVSDWGAVHDRVAALAAGSRPRDAAGERTQRGRGGRRRQFGRAACSRSSTPGYAGSCDSSSSPHRLVPRTALSRRTTPTTCSPVVRPPSPPCCSRTRVTCCRCGSSDGPDLGGDRPVRDRAALPGRRQLAGEPDLGRRAARGAADRARRRDRGGPRPRLRSGRREQRRRAPRPGAGARRRRRRGGALPRPTRLRRVGGLRPQRHRPPARAGRAGPAGDRGQRACRRRARQRVRRTHVDVGGPGERPSSSAGSAARQPVVQSPTS